VSDTKRAERLRKIKAAVDAVENALLEVKAASKSNEAFKSLYYLARLAKKAK
jgi:hypothetical protein